MGTAKSVPNMQTTKVDATFDVVAAMVTAFRALGIFQHDLIVPSLVVTDTGTANLAAVQVLLNAIKAAWNLHLANTDAHVAADATNVVATANATDQASSNALANALKTAFNAHIVLAAAHRGIAGDGKITTAVVATTNAVDLPTSQALTAALLIAYNAHVQNGVPLLVRVNP